ncbi:C40 family peptidase [uncultured Sunxiuqinia sp.]|uniref:C40 family peptidase n=1 Tax=uncultured Sunxiuqinia sp. TaxID=1573825 RepID=UPI0026054C8C|nr:C40 family peptidase [uncultured Sunxiuqinia sp.]
MTKKLRFVFLWIVSLGIGSGCMVEPLKEPVNRIVLNVDKHIVPDHRVAVFEVEARQEAGQVVLRGKTNVVEAHRALLDSLEVLGLSVIDSLKQLPAAELGEHTWALTSLSVSPIRKRPSFASEMVSQAIMGTPVALLDRKGSWYLIQTPDQYVGWITGSSLQRLTNKELKAWNKSNRLVFTEISGTVYSDADELSDPVSDLALGCMVKGLGKQNGYWQVELPDRRKGFVKIADWMTFEQWAVDQPQVEAVIATAKSLLGRPYLWGGTSAKGVDCSGLIKTAYLSQGLILARDASQQARYGQVLPLTDSTRFEPGDLLFFGGSKERITHVALYLENDHYIHASGRVKINSLNPEHASFDAARKDDLVSACRVFNALGTTQITLARDHPWYN